MRRFCSGIHQNFPPLFQARHSGESHYGSGHEKLLFGTDTVQPAVGADKQLTIGNSGGGIKF